MFYSKFFIIIFFTLLLTPYVYSQNILNKYSDIDKKALLIPDSLTSSTAGIAKYINANFSNDYDKSRAIFIWIAKNINYDVENMFAINFYEKREEKIAKSLTTKKGICENYAALFTDICLKTGIKSFVVSGYTKQNGFTNYLSHAWNAAYIDTAWYLFDPTWGSGYIENGKFYKKVNNAFYKSLPTSIIKTHMPFDYLWQFITYPITNKEFCDSKIQTENLRPYFNSYDSIKVWEKQSEIEQLIAQARRIEKNGVQTSLVFDRLRHIKLEIEHYNQNQIKNQYQSAVIDYNDAIRISNDFVRYKNDKFIPEKTDSLIKLMLDSVEIKINEAKSKLNSINTSDNNIINVKNQLLKSIGNLSDELKEKQEWLTQYLGKSKKERNEMFYIRKK